jgi:hypothetical protein
LEEVFDGLRLTIGGGLRQAQTDMVEGFFWEFFDKLRLTIGGGLRRAQTDNWSCIVGGGLRQAQTDKPLIDKFRMTGRNDV